MKKLITILYVLLSISAYSQPVMNGAFDGEGVWGPPQATADGTVGWAGANAKKLYVTFDATYIYLGAEVTASDWQAWAFIINTQTGGALLDSWSRNISYTHTNLPDFTARGHFGGYAEIHTWNGSSWTGYTGLATDEFGESITGSDQNGWVEIRVPKSTLGSPLVSDVQFYITGNNNDHGSRTSDSPIDGSGTSRISMNPFPFMVLTSACITSPLCRLEPAPPIQKPQENPRCLFDVGNGDLLFVGMRILETPGTHDNRWDVHHRVAPGVACRGHRRDLNRHSALVRGRQTARERADDRSEVRSPRCSAC